LPDFEDWCFWEAAFGWGLRDSTKEFMPNGIKIGSKGIKWRAKIVKIMPNRPKRRLKGIIMVY